MVCKVLQHIWVDICRENIESCNRLNKKWNRAQVIFFTKKNCEQLMRVNKDLKDLLNPTDLDFLEGTWLFINDNLCSYYKELWNECKSLRISKENIFVFLPLMVPFSWSLSKMIRIIVSPISIIWNVLPLKEILQCPVYSILVLIYIYFYISFVVFKLSLGSWSICD